MGMFGKPSSSMFDRSVPKLPNPDPNNYEIVKTEEVGNFLVMQIKYPDCTNFEGNKILVFKNVKPITLLKQKAIDPHFFNGKEYASPVARFVPTDDGWAMAMRFAKMESKLDNEDIN